MNAPAADDPEITELLQAMSGGDAQALGRLVPRVYEHLRRLARQRLAGERAGHTLDTTGLVHEAYLRLTGAGRVEWKDRGHFFAIASRIMRRILVDHARKRRAGKRGGARTDLASAAGELLPEATAEALLDLDGALHRIGGGGKLHQHAVARRLDDAAMGLGDRGIYELQPVRLEPCQRARFIEFHEAAIADHVGGEDRHQTAFDGGLLLHRASVRMPRVSSRAPFRSTTGKAQWPFSRFAASMAK